MEYVLETAALTKRYRGQTALSGLDMHVPKGAIYGFVGRNVAGKSTLIRLICGLQEPTSGSHSLYGTSSSDPRIGRARRRMGAVVETPSIYLDLSAEENLRLQSRLLGLPSERGIGELLRLVGLGETGRKKARDFSLGMPQRLGIAVALRGNPDLLVLDEPTNGLDPQGIIEMRELILDLNRQHGITVLISSHILDELSRLATHYGFIDGGRMLREPSAAELESRCRKCQRIETDNVRALVRALDRLGAEYAVADKTHADVFTPFSVIRLARCAEAEGCESAASESGTRVLRDRTARCATSSSRGMRAAGSMPHISSPPSPEASQSRSRGCSPPRSGSRSSAGSPHPQAHWDSPRR